MQHVHSSSLITSLRAPQDPSGDMYQSMSRKTSSVAYSACEAWLKCWKEHRETYSHIDAITNLSLSGLVQIYLKHPDIVEVLIPSMNWCEGEENNTDMVLFLLDNQVKDLAHRSAIYKASIPAQLFIDALIDLRLDTVKEGYRTRVPPHLIIANFVAGVTLWLFTHIFRDNSGDLPNQKLYDLICRKVQKILGPDGIDVSERNLPEGILYIFINLIDSNKIWGNSSKNLLMDIGASWHVTKILHALYKRRSSACGFPDLLEPSFPGSYISN
jgi:hypothetical protein